MKLKQNSLLKINFFNIIASVWVLSSMALACDVCGCRVGGWGTGPLYLPNQHYLSVGYDQSQFESTIDWSEANEAAGGDYLENVYSEDTYRRVTFMANFALNPETRLVLVQPLVYNSQNERNSPLIDLRGWGDGQVRLQRQLLNQSPTFLDMYKQSLLVELGVEVPLGTFNAKDSEGERVNENLQTGSKSWDLIWGASYTLRNMTWGLNQSLNYQWNTENSYHYKRGNQIFTQTSFLYFGEMKKLQYSVAPIFWFEQSEADELYENIRPNRGGHSLGSGGQIQLNYDNWVMNSNVRIPLVQEFKIEKRASISGGLSWGLELGVFI